MRFSVWLGITIVVIVLAAMAMPTAFRYVNLTLQAHQIEKLISAKREFEDLNAAPCLRKFSGVLVTGELPSDSSLQDLIDLLMTSDIKSIRLVINVEGRMIERNLDSSETTIREPDDN